MWPSNVKKTNTNPKLNNKNNNTYLPNTHAHARTYTRASSFTRLCNYKLSNIDLKII